MQRMWRVLRWLAEPLAVLGIAVLLGVAFRMSFAPVRVGGMSMSPTLVPGDIVIVQLRSKPIRGDVVLIQRQGHAPVLHRVIQLLDGGKMQTRGDANDVPDLEPVSSAEVAGREVAVVPIGSMLDRWRGQPPYATMASQPNSTSR